MSKTLKRSFIAVLTFLCGIFMTLSLSLFTARADSRKFELVGGASIRLSTPTGIRFLVDFDETVYNEVFDESGAKEGKTLGMIIVPKQYVVDYDSYKTQNTEYTGTYYEYFRDVKGKMKNFTYSKEQVVEVSEGNYQIKASLVNLLFENLNLEYVGIGYIKTTAGEVDSFEYTPLDMEKNVRSIADVAYNGLTYHFSELNGTEGDLRKILTECYYEANGVTYNKAEAKYYYEGTAYDTLNNIPLTVTTEYKVEHYKKAGTEYVLADTDTLSNVVVGEQVTATAKYYDGFSLTHDSVTSTTAVIEGGVLKLYYDQTASMVDYFAAAAGSKEASHYQGDYYEYANATTLGEYFGKEAIRWNFIGETSENGRRALIIDMQELFGNDLENIASVSFNYYFGTGFTDGMAAMTPSAFHNTTNGWADHTYHSTKLFLIEGIYEDFNYCYNQATATWHSMTLKPQENGLSRYIVLMTDFNSGNWHNNYTADIADGTLDNDYAVYFSDFSVVYSGESEYVSMNTTVTDSVISWDAVDGATGYQIKIGATTNVWTDIGNVTSFDYSTLGEGYHRYAVRAVFADGSFTAASVGTVKNPTLTEKMFAYAEGSLEARDYWGDYYEYDNATSLVTMAGKQAIRLDFLSHSKQNGRRALIIDLQEVFGDDLQNIASVSFSYYFGTGFTSGSSTMTPTNWNTVEAHGTVYGKENLFLIEGVSEDYDCYNKANSKWYSMTLKPQESGLSRYIVLMVDFNSGSWFDNYTADIADGTLDNDYAMYYGDFVVSYK